VQVELIQHRELKLSQAFRAAQRQQSLEASRVQRLALRNRDVRTADDNDYKGITTLKQGWKSLGF